MVGSHDYGVVALSILVSILGAYAALELAERASAARGSARHLWLVGGGAASGIGTWSMHYTAMLGFSLPLPILYHWPTVLASFVPAALSAAGALSLVSPGNDPSRRTLVGASLMGGGIGFLLAWSTSSGVMRTMVLQVAPPEALTASETAEALAWSGTSAMTKASASPKAK
jgi:NO-binding membrane sensor protein with MHYT domain